MTTAPTVFWTSPVKQSDTATISPLAGKVVLRPLWPNMDVRLGGRSVIRRVEKWGISKVDGLRRRLSKAARTTCMRDSVVRLLSQGVRD